MVDTASAWNRLCSLIDDDEHLWPAVQSALDDPEGDPWAALIDGLDDAGALAYLHSDDSGMELTDALVQLPRVFRLQPDLNAVTDTDDLGEAMRAADGVLHDAGYALLALDDDDEDSHALVVVEARSEADLLAVAAELKQPLTVID